ncbi:hypothetical protein M201_gp69 [Haloarcula californiae tailed virus 2]|uniref:Uncharacterized protein n=1 Tax=Haloarcula californiae tailed virus 2 TaxID=1273747 RepID=R4THS2_9CAUD|nr:hypothetical protein M201_gp69 [Haloarcula californiae tailed virus 2]AGM11861.1 hypothetical protein HCTV2_77 [Haloarcula californiae tailed virus 2]
MVNTRKSARNYTRSRELPPGIVQDRPCPWRRGRPRVCAKVIDDSGAAPQYDSVTHG